MPVFDPRERSIPVLPSVILANIIPLVAIISYDFSFFSLIYLYWWETVLLSIFNFMKMGSANKTGEPDPNLKINGRVLSHEQVNNRKYMRRMYIFVRMGMLIFYLIFIVVFIGVLGMDRGDDPAKFGETILLIDPWIRIGLAAFFITHLLEYIVWRRDGSAAETTLRELGSPFDARVIVMHLVIVLGTFLSMFVTESMFPNNPKAGSIAYASIFVILKTIVDLLAYVKNTKRTTVITALQPRPSPQNENRP